MLFLTQTDIFESQILLETSVTVIQLLNTKPELLNV